MFAQSVEIEDELSHDGGDGDLEGLVGLEQTLVEVLKVGIEATGAEGRHVESAAHLGAPSLDRTAASLVAAIAVVRSYASQSSTLPAVE